MLPIAFDQLSPYSSWTSDIPTTTILGSLVLFLITDKKISANTSHNRIASIREVGTFVPPVS